VTKTLDMDRTVAAARPSRAHRAKNIRSAAAEASPAGARRGRLPGSGRRPRTCS